MELDSRKIDNVNKELFEIRRISQRDTPKSEANTVKKTVSGRWSYISGLRVNVQPKEFVKRK